MALQPLGTGWPRLSRGADGSLVSRTSGDSGGAFFSRVAGGSSLPRHSGRALESRRPLGARMAVAAPLALLAFLPLRSPRSQRSGRSLQSGQPREAPLPLGTVGTGGPGKTRGSL